MDPSSSTSAHLPQRRVLPSRSRRGGPGVGNCEADQMILDMNRRKPENEPLIPETTRFFLTTNAALAPPELDAIPQLLNPRANERYFDRPELLKAYRQQREIEVPEYENVTETVGGRFRPRGSEDGIVDTSDAAYERRHRKYETFEKRVRLREKEKLKHEQYKLHERIEQLRLMEYSAFLSLPASAFSPAPGRIGDDVEGPGISGLPGAHINGAAAMNEAERRRQEMLDAAQVIENRYKMLLPPDRIRKVNGSTSSTPILPASSPPPELADISIPTKASHVKPYRQDPTDDGETEIDETDEVVESSPPPLEKPTQPKLLIKINRSAINTPTPPLSTSVSTGAKMGKQYMKKNLKSKPQPELNGVFSADTPMSSPDIAVLETSDPSTPAKKRGRKRPHPDEGEGVPDQPPVPPRRRKKTKPQPVLNQEAVPVPGHRAESQPKTTTQQDEIVVLPTPHSESGPPFNKETSVPPIAFLDESASAPVPRRRAISSYPARIRSTSVAPRARPPPPPKPCLLVVTAERHSIQTVSRKGRNTNAFGCKVPVEIDMELDYELPLWILQDDEFQRRFSKYPDAKDKFNPELVLNPKFNPKKHFEEQLVDALNSEKEREATEASTSDSDETEEEAEEQDQEEGAGEQEDDAEEEQAKEESEEGDEGLEEETTEKSCKRAPKTTADEDEQMRDVEALDS